MPDGLSIPVLDHQLADDELAWVRGVYRDFDKARAEAKGPFDPKETLRGILGRPEHQLASPMDLTGPGPWRNGRNAHGRLAAAVFLKTVELHKHEASRTDQFPMYVVGEADGFALDNDGNPILIPVEGGGHFHNHPGAPHAFVPKVGKPVNDDWEIVFIAITPRNLREDTQEVADEVKRKYESAVGRPAPHGV